MIILFCILYFLLFVYAMVMVIPAMAWFSRKSYIKRNSSKQKSISIIIPCRNEAENIVACLSYFKTAVYETSLTEIIVVDDCSEDETASLVKNFIAQHSHLPLKLIELKENLHAKKGALTKGIELAKGEIIITLDADCVPQSNAWIERFSSAFDSEETALVMAEVSLKSGNGIIGNFLWSEHVFLQMQGAGFCILEQAYLCNGANLAFRKSVFMETGGYSGNEHTASGDDIFLLRKIKSLRKYKIGFCTEAAVETAAPQNMKQIISQRLRWAGKFFRTLSWQAFFTALSVSGIQVLFIILTLLSLVFTEWYKYLILCVLIKLIIDFLLLILASLRFRRWAWLVCFPLLEVLNVFYAVIMPLCMVFVSTKWKGRSLNSGRHA